MPRELPMACSLDATGLEDRARELAELGSSSLTGHRRDGGAHRLCFRFSPETERRLRAAVAAEAECCPFLTLTVSRDDEALELRIEGPEEAQPAVDLLAAAFEVQATAS
jgi:hypothetical protein